MEKGNRMSEQDKGAAYVANLEETNQRLQAELDKAHAELAMVRGEAPIPDEPAKVEPARGQIWRHHSGRLYRVAALANVNSTKPAFPVMVIYTGPGDHLWARPLSDWHRSFGDAPIARVHNRHDQFATRDEAQTTEQLIEAYQEGRKASPNTTSTYAEGTPCTYAEGTPTRMAFLWGGYAEAMDKQNARLIKQVDELKSELMAKGSGGALFGDHKMGDVFESHYDGFTGTLIGTYLTREHFPGYVLQDINNKVVHVYRLKHLNKITRES
jgi:hypothetical protein